MRQIEADSEVEELCDLFQCSNMNISHLYEKHGYWKTYHMADLVCNHGYELEELLSNIRLLGNYVRNANKIDESMDITEMILNESLRFYPKQRTEVVQNIMYADTVEENLNRGHLQEHIISRIGD